MKYTIKLLALVLALAVILSVGIVGCKGNGENKAANGNFSTTPINTTAEYVPLMGNQSSWLNANPDRGYRTEMVVFLYDTAEHNPELLDDPRAICVNDSEDDIRKICEYLMRLYLLTENKLTISYIFFQDCNTDEQIPDKYLKALDIYLDTCRSRNIRIIWRHCYGITTNKYIANKADREYLAKVCADEETMIRHIKQLGEYIGKNTDVIEKISAGAIGNGEYTASFQWPPVDFNKVTEAIMQYMCLPNNLQFSVRLPRYATDFLEWWKETHGGEEYPYKHMIGFNNDCVYGEVTRVNANSSCFQYNHTPNGCKDGKGCFMLSDEAFDEWQYVIENCAYTSQCGEMFTNQGMVYEAEIFTKGFDVIKEMAHHRHTTLSNWHTMGESGDSDNNVMKHWAEQETVTAEMLDNAGIIYDPNWFKDENGNTIDRNPYDFIRDHLGYKLVAEKSNLSGDLGRKGTLKVDLTFKNYGFAAAFFLESGFAILDSKYNVVSTVEAGDPNKWISLPADYYATEKNSSVQDDVITYTIDATLTLPETEGTYYIAFYLKNGLNDYAMLSNDIKFEGDGFNILHTIEI